MSEGFLLAATIHRDRNAALGQAGLSGPAASAVASWSDALKRLGDNERRAKIAAISRQMIAPLSNHGQGMPTRALALLAPFVERSVGEAWLRQAPAPRIGYAAEPGLRRVLRTIAERGTWHG